MVTEKFIWNKFPSRLSKISFVQKMINDVLPLIADQTIYLAFQFYFYLKCIFMEKDDHLIDFNHIINHSLFDWFQSHHQSLFLWLISTTRSTILHVIDLNHINHFSLLPSSCRLWGLIEHHDNAWYMDEIYFTWALEFIAIVILSSLIIISILIFKACELNYF